MNLGEMIGASPEPAFVELRDVLRRHVELKIALRDAIHSREAIEFAIHSQLYDQSEGRIGRNAEERRLVLERAFRDDGRWQKAMREEEAIRNQVDRMGVEVEIATQKFRLLLTQARLLAAQLAARSADSESSTKRLMIGEVG